MAKNIALLLDLGHQDNSIHHILLTTLNHSALHAVCQRVKNCLLKEITLWLSTLFRRVKGTKNVSFLSRGRNDYLSISVIQSTSSFRCPSAPVY